MREYETRNAGTAQYEIALIKNVLIRFAFTGVEQVQVDDFNFQNVINSLEFRRESEAPESRVQVEIESIYGFGASWFCSSARVASVTKLATSEA